MVFRHQLQPYGLPDSALGGIKHAAFFQLLFPAAEIGAVAEILYPDEKFVVVTGVLCDIQRKRKVASGMGAGLPAVQVNDAFLIHGSEVEDHPFSLPVTGEGKVPPVPEVFSRKKLAFYA